MKTNLTLRWLALIAVLLNVAFNFIYTYLPGLPSIQAVTAKYPSLFTPASYAFTIWALIYAAMTAYAVYPVLPSQKLVPVHDRISRPLILSNLLGIAWIISYTNEIMLLSVIIIGAMLALAILMYVRMQYRITHLGYKYWTVFPFSLFAAWLMVATIANAYILFAQAGWQYDAHIAVSTTMILLTVVGAVGIIVNYKYSDPAFPLVIIWAAIGIYFKTQDEHPKVAGFALIISALVMLWTAIYSLSIERRKLRLSHQH
jgi:hypothetical protein